MIQTWKEVWLHMYSNAVLLHEKYVLSKMVRFCLLLEYALTNFGPMSGNSPTSPMLIPEFY